MSTLFAEFSGRRVTRAASAAVPLIVAIHGGTYTSAYFDVPGCSFLERCEANGIPALALDRPGYGETPMLSLGKAGIWGQAFRLREALAVAWRRFGSDTRGIVLVGHSIGGAIAAVIAGEVCDFPLLGIAASGVGLHIAPADRPILEPTAATHADLPVFLKDQQMFGPQGSFDDDLRARSHGADAPTLLAEVVDITGGWPHRVHDVLGRVKVPFHYRQAEQDGLWVVDEKEVRDFAGALTQSPRVDAAMIRHAGHCMDFHHVGPALHLQQLGFALQCAIDGNA